MKTIQLPFDGFYYSITESIIECAQDRAYEHLQYTPTLMPGWQQKIAQKYASQYEQWLSENDFFVPDFVFIAISSPRFYNFETDQVFCGVSDKDLEILFNQFLKNGIDNCQQVINDNLRSRSGFYSFHDDFCDNWQALPILEWPEQCLFVLLPVPDYSDLWESAYSNGFFDDLLDYKEA